MTMSQKETTTKSKSPMYGKAWRRASVHTSYETAAAEKERLTTEQSDVTVKIRRTADHKFVVKTRTTVAEAPAKSKPSSPPKSKAQRKKAKAAKHKARQEKDKTL